MKTTRISIERGSVDIRPGTAARIRAQGDGVVAITVDLRSKWACLAGHGDGALGVGVFLEAGPRTTHTTSRAAILGDTGVWFPDFKGWTVFCADVSKYMLRVVLVRSP